MLCHDPRISNDPENRIETNNPALIAAELARQMFPDNDVDWDEVAEGADYCDWPVDATTGKPLNGGEA